MKLIYIFVLGILFSSSLGWANHSIHCGTITAKRSLVDRRLMTRVANAFKVAAQKKHSEYPWDFDLVWIDSIGYLWQEKVTGSYLMINGDRVAFSSPLDDSQVNQWTEVDFPPKLKQFWFASLQSKQVLKANREVLAIWFTRSVYPTLIAHDFEKAAAALKERELTAPEFNHLMRRLALVQNIVEVPPFKLVKHNKLIQLRVTPPISEPNHSDEYIIHTHARFSAALESGGLLENLFGGGFTRARGAWDIGHLYHYTGTGFQADAFSIPAQLAVDAKDSLSDLLYGLESQGEVILDFYPTTGHFSLSNDSDRSREDRAQWKSYFESLIRDHGLTPIAE